MQEASRTFISSGRSSPKDHTFIYCIHYSVSLSKSNMNTNVEHESFYPFSIIDLGRGFQTLAIGSASQSTTLGTIVDCFMLTDGPVKFTADRRCSAHSSDFLGHERT